MALALLVGVFLQLELPVERIYLKSTLCQALLSETMRRERKQKRPSSQDVAELAGVSRATVSAYINKNRYVSDELVERIENAIQKLSYIPDAYARALKFQDAKTIGLIIPVLSKFFTPMMRAINEVAHQNHYGFLFSSSEEDVDREREVLEIMVAKRTSGILLVPCSVKNLELLRKIQQYGTPIVQVSRMIEGIETDIVISNNYKAFYTATEHLIAKGRRRIVFFGDDPESIAYAEAKKGYDAALKNSRIEENITVFVKQGDPNSNTIAFRAFLESGRPFDGLICSSQTKTSTALQFLKERNIKIPEEVAVVGFEETPWASMLWKPLTVISESTYQMGGKAIQLLLDRLEKREIGPPKKIVLESEFIIQQST
jgi:LacI family transcriptional regulator